MTIQSITGMALILIGAVISLIGFFVISPINDFITSVLVTAIGFVLIGVGGGITKTRLGMWVQK